MRTLPIFLLTIDIEKDTRWAQCFVGRPTKNEIADAIIAWTANELKGTSNETGKRMAKAKCDHLITLVQDHWDPDDTRRICTYAGVTVGNIKLEAKPDALETIAAMPQPVPASTQ